MTDKEQIIINGVDVICEYCYKQFKKKKYEYNRNKHHFCSQILDGEDYVRRIAKTILDIID